MFGRLARLIPYALAFFSSLCIMVLELVASRLVAQHVGASLIVWTSVIGIILGGICLGNVLGGRLADRVEPRRALGPLFAMGALLTIACLWINAYVARLPGLSALPWDLRTVLIVTLDFLIPATVLGMISPVVAKMAVEQSRRSGTALGDVYTLGAVGSIVGTFLAGFWLLYIAPTSTIVAIVAAALALLAAALANGIGMALLGLGACVFLTLGTLESIGGWLSAPGLQVGTVKVNAWAGIGHALMLLLAVVAWRSLGGWRTFRETAWPVRSKIADEEGRPTLADLAVLAFVASLGFMALEMVAGRLVTRHLGSSVYSWTSVIGILLGGLSLGNYLGGKAADRIQNEKQASTLFLFASIGVAAVLLMETPPTWLVRNPIGYFFQGEPPIPLAGDGSEFLSQAIGMAGYPWGLRVLFWTAVVFLIPSATMGTVSPVVAKLAVDRLRRSGRTGSAIGVVYAWGMVGSLVGTFLTGFLLIDWIGTKGVILLLATTMALAATVLGSVWHAAWAGIPLGLCVIAFLPPLIPEGNVKEFFVKQGLSWGLREKPGDPNDADADIAYIDESNYYFIKVNNDVSEEGTKRTLVLDNLIHGYIFLGQPTKLDYDYEHIYALVTHRLMQAKAKAAGVEGPEELELGTLFLGGGSYTFPRYLQAIYPKTWAEVAEIDPAVTRANHAVLGLPKPDRTLPKPKKTADGQAVTTIRGQTIKLGRAGTEESREAYFQALRQVAPAYQRDPATGEGIATIEGEKVRFGPYESAASRQAYLKAVQDWYANSKYTIRTTWGDARQYVVRHQDKRFDVVYGDAFNDFSVPWHLTTREFNDKLANMLTDNGVYMINIIDAYESDAIAAEDGPRLAMTEAVANAVGRRWKGDLTRDEVAEELVFTMIPKGFADALERATGSVAKALQADQRVMSREELLRLVRDRLANLPEPAEAVAAKESDDKANEPEQPRLDVLAERARTALGVLYGQEVLHTLDHARTGLLQRYEHEEIDTPAPTMILGTIRGIRTAGEAVSEPEKRIQVMDDTLAHTIEAARNISQADPQTLTDAIDKARVQLIEHYDAKALSALQVKVVLDFLGGLLKVAEEEVQNRPANFDSTLANSAACRVAGEVAKTLDGARRAVAEESAAILQAMKSGPDLAADAARTVAAFAKDRDRWAIAITDSVLRARGAGAFVGAWINTARLTLPHVYVFGTNSERGSGGRETFVVVASRQPLDLADLGERPGDPEFFFSSNGVRHLPEPYPAEDLKALEIRSRGIVLTDDYAPVENLLAPIADRNGN